jgi:hypothetical protein
MNNASRPQLNKLYDRVKNGSRGFNVVSLKPHLDICKSYGSLCKTVTVFGVETGCSVAAFLVSGCKKLYAYDLNITANAKMIEQAAENDNVFFRLYQKDHLKVKIKKTDLLFIDTDHWYGQIKAELEHHHNRVRKWILMHDTETFGLINPFDGRPGMKAAIYEFMEAHPEWQIKEHFDMGHGLTVLENTVLRKWWW